MGIELERGQALKAAIEKAKVDWKANRNKEIALLEMFCTHFPMYIGHISHAEFTVGAQNATNWETAKATLTRGTNEVAVEMQLHDFCGLGFKANEKVSVSIDGTQAKIEAFDLCEKGTVGTDFEAGLPQFFDKIIKTLPCRYLMKEPPRSSSGPGGSKARIGR